MLTCHRLLESNSALLSDGNVTLLRCYSSRTKAKQASALIVCPGQNQGWNSCPVDSTVGGFLRTMKCKLSGVQLGFTKQWLAMWALISQTEQKKVLSRETLSGLLSEVNIMRYRESRSCLLVIPTLDRHLTLFWGLICGTSYPQNLKRILLNSSWNCF